MTRYTHGDQVIVVDNKGNHMARGRIVIVSHGWPPRNIPAYYAVMPDGERSLTKALHQVTDEMIRPMGLRLVREA